jgi:hypothetical protein
MQGGLISGGKGKRRIVGPVGWGQSLELPRAFVPRGGRRESLTQPLRKHLFLSKRNCSAENQGKRSGMASLLLGVFCRDTEFLSLQVDKCLYSLDQILIDSTASNNPNAVFWLTEALAMDLRGRILNRPQITSDGYSPYVGAVTVAFQTGVDFAVLTKKYGSDSNLPDAAHRYSPSHVTGIEKAVIRGNPDENEISTSYVERFNLSTRMASRRFTRLTNGFSKKLENHSAAIALWIGFYNFCRIHESLRCTPAMALGVTDHIWSIAELMEAALEPSDIPPIPRTPSTTLRPVHANSD